MEFKLTSESMGSLIDRIIHAVEFYCDYNDQYDSVKSILECNGILEIEGDK